MGLCGFTTAVNKALMERCQLCLLAPGGRGDDARDLVAPRANFEGAQQPAAADQAAKGAVVAPANAVVHPYAMVVEPRYTASAPAAVLAA